MPAGGQRDSRGRSKLTKAAAPGLRRSTRPRRGVGVSSRPLRVNEGGEAKFDGLTDPNKIVSRWESMFVVLFSLFLSGSCRCRFFGQIQQNRAAAARSPGSKGQSGAGQKPPPPLTEKGPRPRHTGSKPVRQPPRRVDEDDGSIGSASSSSSKSHSSFEPDADANGSPLSTVRPPVMVRTPPVYVRAGSGPSAGAAAARWMYSPSGKGWGRRTSVAAYP